MINEDMKEQISLFELQGPPQPAEKPERREPKIETETLSQTESTAPKVEIKPTAVEPPTPPKPAGLRTKSPSTSRGRQAKAAPAPVPEGDVRLTANIRQDLHLKLKIAAATRRTTIGELIEALVEKYL